MTEARLGVQTEVVVASRSGAAYLALRTVVQDLTDLAVARDRRLDAEAVAEFIACAEALGAALGDGIANALSTAVLETADTTRTEFARETLRCVSQFVRLVKE